MKQLVICSLLLLSACQSSEERKADWLKFCEEGEFTAKQCLVLYSLKKSSDETESSAASASVMSGVALGMNAGSSRSHR